METSTNVDVKVRVRDLSESVLTSDLFDTFSKYGIIKDIKREDDTATIEFSAMNMAQKALLVAGETPRSPEKVAGPPKTDFVILAVDRKVTPYANEVRKKLSELGFNAEIKFPKRQVPIRKLLKKLIRQEVLRVVIADERNIRERTLVVQDLNSLTCRRTLKYDEAIEKLKMEYEKYVMRHRKTQEQQILAFRRLFRGPSNPPSDFDRYLEHMDRIGRERQRLIFR